MTLPVSSYEALLAQIRELTHETILLQQQLTADLVTDVPRIDINHNVPQVDKNRRHGQLFDQSIDYEERQLFEAGVPNKDINPVILHPRSMLLDNFPEALDTDELTAKLIIWQDKLKFREDQEEAVRRGKQQQSGTLHPDKPDLPVYHPHIVNSITTTYQLCPEQKPESPRKHFSPKLRCNHRASDNVMDVFEQEADQKHEIYSQSSRCYEEETSSDDDLKAEDTPEGCTLSQLHGTWPVKQNTWIGQGFVGQSASNSHDMASVMSFSSGSACSGGLSAHRRLGSKVDVVYSLLGMLGSTEGCDDMSGTLLAMSNSVESCLVMRQSGCLPLLIQLIHTPGQSPETRDRACRALHNVIHARIDGKLGRREPRVLRLLEQIRDYCQLLRLSLETERPPDDLERHPGPTIAAIMKLSFDEAHRHAMCQLGGLHAVAELIEMDHAAHGTDSDDQSCITLRRYAGMALTNLTFGDGNNKALLCSFREFMKALVTQLQSLSDDLRQVTASVLRNLSWRADSSSKQTLREVGAVIGLMQAAMEGRKESTLKSILSALWNLSAHCSTNKVDICAVQGALGFLVDMLSYKAPSKTLAIVENAGGILRNVSSHIAVREDYRIIVRERGCLQVLLRQLRSPSLTVVSNACGALWNLSARCPHDQKLLWDLGAVPMLRSLVHSKHKMISMGSSAALKNLLSARPGGTNLVHLDSTARGLGLPTLPTLNARRQRALEQEIDHNLSETCENIEPSTSPTTKDDKFSFKDTSLPDNPSKRTYARHNGVPRSESRESMRSVTSTHSDTIFERVHRHVNGFTPTELQIKQQSSSLHGGFSNSNRDTGKGQLEKRYALKYKNSVTQRLRPTDLGITGSTISWTTGPDHESFLRSSIEKRLSTGPSGKDSPFSRIKTPSPVSPGNFNSNSFNPIISPTSSHTSDTDPFGNYAETDLDQPTNYSLRYAEHNSDDDKQSSGYFAGSEQDIEDTVKTYCTEGTPYGTSLNSSRAASHSDLQEDRIKHLTLKPHITKAINPPLNSIELPSDVDSGVPVEDIDSTDDRVIVQSTITRLTSLIVDAELRASEKKPKDIKFRRSHEPESLTESMASDGEDDEDLLAACIHVGMQNNRHRQSFRRNSLEKFRETNLNRYQTNTQLDQVDKLCEVDAPHETKSEQPASLEPMGSESTESYDSVERSEQVLLEFCIKSAPANVETGFSESPEDPSNAQDLSSMSKKTDSEEHDQYRRQRDPDAMIASLDRLTATLVQQTEAMRERDSSAMKASVQSDMWNEDSPNDTVPTISMSVPLVASFKSEMEEKLEMTTSRIIEREAFKLAEAVNAEFRVMAHDLEAIKPPSAMNSLVSLTNSYAGPDIMEYPTIRDSNSLNSPIFKHRGRKKSLPIGIMAKRALGQAHSQPGSLESLFNESLGSQLENVKPPSMMDELLDTGELDNMENSMLSVASITSEIADSRDNDSPGITSESVFDMIKPVANVLSMSCLRFAENSANNSLSEYLENINPPSLFNEISDMDDTTIDANTDTMCSDTLCIDVELVTEENHPVIERIEEVDDTDEAATPLSTEYSLSSSAESTPKKRLSSKSHLTPKQKRQLAKERYKTYTIAAELVKKEEERRKHKDGIHRPKLSPFTKLTPKQRRQEDRARFQTQVLQVPLVNLKEDSQPSIATAPAKTGIPSLRKIGSRLTKKNHDQRAVSTWEGTSEVSTIEPKADDLVDDTISLVANETGAQLTMRLDGNSFSTIVKKTNGCTTVQGSWQVEEQVFDEQANEDSDSEEQGRQVASDQPKRPRIVKPGSRASVGEPNEVEEMDPTSPKGIRGRRKALYSKPIVKKVTPQGSPVRQGPSGIPVGRSVVSTMPRATRATTLRQNTNFNAIANVTKAPARNTNVKSMALSKRSSIPQRGSTITEDVVKRHSTPPCLSSPGKKEVKLERQGTFTKDEPEMENTPMVNSPTKAKVAKRGSPSFVKSKISVRNGQADKIAAAKRQEPPKSAENSGQGKKVVNLGQRSNSNSSLMTPVGSQKLAREATSKIASLWKKVEENRNKQKYEKPDTRQWITADKVESASQLPTLRLFRSSTFEGVPKETGVRVGQKLGRVAEGAGGFHRNSYDLGEMRGQGARDRKLPVGYGTVVLRKQRSEGDDTKRISRLGSFFRVESDKVQSSGSTIVTCNGRNEGQRNDVGIVTASSKVTTV